MGSEKQNYFFVMNVVLASFISLFLGCTSFDRSESVKNYCEPQSAVHGASNVSVFLNILHQDAKLNARLKIYSIELLVDDLWVPFSSSLPEIHSSDLKHTQRFLGRQWLKGQFCRGIRAKVALSPITYGVTRTSDLSLINSDVEIMLQNPLVLESESRRVMFLEWDLGKSVSASEPMGPALTAYSGVAPRISANLVYVACPDIDTIYVVRSDKFQVVDAFPANGKPSYLSTDFNNKTIYVLSGAHNKINSYDALTHFPTGEINIPLTISPTFMAINRVGKVAYVLDSHGVLTSMDLASGNMINRNRIGNAPNYVHYISGLGKLAVSSTFDQAVYLVNTDSLGVEDYVKLGSAPQGSLAWGNYLYIAESATNSISIYDLSLRKMLKNIRVGLYPTRFVAGNNTLYLANQGDGTLSVLQGGQFSVSKDVYVGNKIREMVVAEKQRLLFVGSGDCDGSLTAIDTTGNQVVGFVELGARPAGIIIIE